MFVKLIILRFPIGLGKVTRYFFFLQIIRQELDKVEACLKEMETETYFELMKWDESAQKVRIVRGI